MLAQREKNSSLTYQRAMSDDDAAQINRIIDCIENE